MRAMNSPTYGQTKPAKAKDFNYPLPPLIIRDIITTMKSKSGFTIVEILIVIIIIGILASVSVFAYNGVQNRGTRNAAEANLRQNFDKIATWTADNGAPPANTTELISVKLQTNKKFYSNGTNSYVFCRTSTQYALIAATMAGDQMIFSSNNGLKDISAANWGTSVNTRCSNNLSGSTPFSGLTSTNAWQPWTGAF